MLNMSFSLSNVTYSMFCVLWKMVKTGLVMVN